MLPTKGPARKSHKTSNDCQGPTHQPPWTVCTGPVQGVQAGCLDAASRRLRGNHLHAAQHFNSTNSTTTHPAGGSAAAAQLPAVACGQLRAAQSNTILLWGELWQLSPQATLDLDGTPPTDPSPHSVTRLTLRLHLPSLSRNPLSTKERGEASKRCKCAGSKVGTPIFLQRGLDGPCNTHTYTHTPYQTPDKRHGCHCPNHAWHCQTWHHAQCDRHHHKGIQ